MRLHAVRTSHCLRAWTDCSNIEHAKQTHLIKLTETRFNSISFFEVQIDEPLLRLMKGYQGTKPPLKLVQFRFGYRQSTAAACMVGQLCIFLRICHQDWLLSFSFGTCPT